MSSYTKMHFISLVHSIPALDMSLGLLLQLREFQMAESITTILKLARGMRVPSSRFLFELVKEVSDEIFIVGDNNLHREAEEVFTREDAPFSKYVTFPRIKMVKGVNRIFGRFRAYRANRDLSRLVKHVRHNSVLFRSHADVDFIATHLGEAVRAQGGRVYVYLEGCYPPYDSLPMKYFRNARPELADLFLLYSDAHAQALSSAGYKVARTIGYPKLYPAWRKAVRGNSAYVRLKGSKAPLEVSVFTRGEYIGGGPQIMPNETLTKILSDIFDVVLSEKGSHISLKPHPAQDVDFLEKLISSYNGVSITYDHPSLLGSTSDLVITTWSTSIIDALIFKKPCIEYFIENNYFRSIYPRGSSFRQLGIEHAEDKESFCKSFKVVRSVGYKVPDINEKLGHRMDLEIFAEQEEVQGKF